MERTRRTNETLQQQLAASRAEVLELGARHSQQYGLTLFIANNMGWETMKDLMIEEYCPRGEVQKLKQELWNLTMKGTNVIAYTARFSELVALCPNMVPTEGKKIERYK